MELYDGSKQSKTLLFEDVLQSLERTNGISKLINEVFEEVNKWDDASKSELIIHILENYHKLKDSYGSSGFSRYAFNWVIGYFCRKKFNYGDSKNKILHLINEIIKERINGNTSNEYKNSFTYTVKPLLNNMVRYNSFETMESQEQLLFIQSKLEILNSQHHYDNKEISVLLQKINNAIYIINDKNKTSVKPNYFIGSDTFKDFANGIIDCQNENDRKLWYRLIAIAQKVSGGKPSQTFLNESKALMDVLGAEKFKKVIYEWFSFVIKLEERTTNHTNTHNNYTYTFEEVEFLNPLNSNALKGFVWMSSWFHDNRTIQIISKLALRCFKKIQKKGPAAAGLGNACLYALYASKGLGGIAQLSKLKLKIKQNSTINLIENYLDEAASKKGVSTHEIEDIAVDEFNLQNHRLTSFFDDFTGVIELTDIGKSTLKWFKKDGSVQKSVPQLIKDKFGNKLKKLKEIQKELNQTTSVQKERLDRMLRSNRVMSLEYFRDNYIDHELLSFVINRLIFHLSNDKKSKLAIYLNKQWIGLDSLEVEIEQYTHISLWHPVNSNRNVVKEWRQYLMDSQIQQPFKQAFREIYLLTEAEINTETYSNRMASHILKQYQYVTLAKVRNWKANLISVWDGGEQDAAELYLPEYNLIVEYWVNALNADDQSSDSGIWNYVVTDQIRFINTETNELVKLANVPAAVFSEAMRDVDLFVGVASVGNDPTWRDSGGLPTHRDYWQSYSFGDLSEIAKNRKEILIGLIPRLKIASVTRIEDRFVIVKGKFRTYKIHIGSTNILMEPNDQYLCIVPERSNKSETENLFLPFEGDSGLSIIISKALLLANDDKITDSSITSQIIG